MKMTIGFHTRDESPKPPEQPMQRQEESNAGTPKMVLVQFQGCNIPLSYYCEDLDVHAGDLVFVEGKYEGTPGRVEKISTNFNVNLDEFKRVIGVADTHVVGSFKPLNGYFISFDRNALPFKKARSWFMPPTNEDSFIDYDEPGFLLAETKKWPVKSVEIMDRGYDYYMMNHVTYLSLDGCEGRAIVSGSKPYQVRFKYQDGMITNITCTCPCGYFCKHEVATLFQLQEILRWLEESGNTQFQDTQYFSIITVSALYRYAVKIERDNELILR